MSKHKDNLELLSPAGDLTRLKYALAYGADAVYLGLPDFSLRAKTGFDFKSLKEGIAYAHKLKKKVYVIVNIFAHNSHLKKLPDFLKKLKVVKPDAIILSDPGVLTMVKKYLPKVPIHLSTQANALNCEAVKFWYQNGVRRIILGREATLEDIKQIHKQVPKMELEVFVHGAMCMSYSGRCYLSAWLNSRSANEGSCTQPCRWEYKMYMEEPLRPGMMIPLEEDDKGIYILNSKDLCLIDYLGELAKAGVKSFKIEGRTKSHYYVAVATKAYRQAIDSIGVIASVAKQSHRKKNEIASSSLRTPRNDKSLQTIKKELSKIDNRGYTTGFLFGDEGIKRQEFTTSKQKSDWQFVGEVVPGVIPAKAGISSEKHEIPVSTGMTGKQIVYFKPHNMLRAGDALELLTPKDCYKIKVKEFFNKDGQSLKEIHGGTKNVYSFKLSKECDTGWGILRKRIG